MNKIRLLSLLLVITFIGLPVVGFTQLIGRWKTIGDRDGEEKAIIEIYEKEGKIFGRVEKLLPSAKITTCSNCTGELKDSPLTGMVIMKDLVKTNTGANDGKILDPDSGKNYSCYIELQSPDKLKLRGYLGVPTIGRTQYWYRVKS